MKIDEILKIILKARNITIDIPDNVKYNNKVLIML